MRQNLPVSVMWSIIVVMAGIIWTLSGRSSQLDTMTTQLAVITGQLSKLAESYNVTDKLVGVQAHDILEIEQHLDRIETHLTNNDTRLSRAEK